MLAFPDSLYFYVPNSTASTGLNTSTNISNDDSLVVQRTPWTRCQLNARNTLSFNESVTADALSLYLVSVIHHAVGIVEVEIWIPANPGPRYEAEGGLISFSSRGGSIGIWRRYHGGSLIPAQLHRRAAWNQHDCFYFIGVSTVSITLDDLMDLDNTNSEFEYWESRVADGLAAGLPYVSREMCSVDLIGIHGITVAILLEHRYGPSTSSCTRLP
jgi:hypothetical protein